ncbi:MAG: hypothetical protein V1721_01775 [Pseudomonadota bacterium]
MITLNLKREPYWINLLDGVSLYVRPATTALIMAARAATLKENIENDIERASALIRHLGRLAILEWKGIGDPDGNPAPVTPETVGALLDLWPVSEAFERLYLTPALLLEQEKNG